MLKDLDSLAATNVTRRSFVKGTVAAGAAAALFGCSKNDDGDTYVIGDEDGGGTVEIGKEPTAIYGSATHNCGGRCVSKAIVSNGRIIRILTDEANLAGDGSYLDANSRNLPQTRACSRCRGYRYRVHHPGRLRYPLKQMGKRGDLSSFVRISWEQAYKEIITKHKAVTDTYGLDGIYVLYDSSANAGVQGRDALETAYRYMGYENGSYVGGHWKDQFGSYSTHQNQYIGTGYTGVNNETSMNDIANNTNTLVLWGDNAVTTYNNTANSLPTLADDLRKRGAKTYYVGPSFSDTGIVMADEWLAAKPFTDVALIAGMLYHMLDNTFDLNTGAVKQDPWLDVDYLDTMVYGFFDSPEYFIDSLQYLDGTPTSAGTTVNTANGTISNIKPNTAWYQEDAETVLGAGRSWWSKSGTIQDTKPTDVTGWTQHYVRWTNGTNYTYSQPTHKVEKVDVGRSYCSWILGNNNNAPAYAATTTNYTANTYATLPSVPKRWAPCAYEAAAGTVYKTKQAFTVPKTPQWAADITGIDVEAIKELAERFCNEKYQPVTSIWSGGQQKQAEGCVNLFAVQALQIITGNVAKYGATFGRMGPSVVSLTNAEGALPVMTNNKSGSAISKNIPASPQRPTASCTAWHTIIKSAFAEEMYNNGYRANYIPNWPTDGSGNRIFNKGVAYWDDGGTKAAAVQWKRSIRTDRNGVTRAMVDTYTGADGKEYYEWIGRLTTGQPVYSGIRLMYNSASNIIINQHENSNDSMEMMEYLNPCKYDDAESFCLVTFDNFMSPTTRWSDYVLPSSTAWEHPNYIEPNHAMGFFVSQAANPPGESRQAFEYCKELLSMYESMNTGADKHKDGTDATAKEVGVAAAFAGGKISNSIEQLAREAYFKQEMVVGSAGGTIQINAGPFHNPKSPFYGKTWEEYLKNPVLVKKPNDLAKVSPTGFAVMRAYQTADKTKPFIKAGQSITTNTVDKSGYATSTNSQNYVDLFADTSDAPQPSMRYHVYSRMLTWGYENMFSKWHGFLPAAERGQKHRDFEGDRYVLEIPVYYAYEDYHMEAYGNDPAKVAQLPFTLTTTHNKYRSHSSLAESPMMRELYARVPGRDAKGNPLPGNDYNEYSMGPDQEFTTTGTFPYLARTIEDDGTVKEENKAIASYSEIWMNTGDAEGLNIKDGDLVQVENPIGAVRCVARLSRRCVEGYVDLHQGCWFDPRPLPNGGGGIYNHPTVDVGGNVNTLMASQPSRIDHGNGQQSAMVRIFRVEQ